MSALKIRNLGYRRNKLSIVNTLHKRELCNRSRTNEFFFVSVYRVYSVSIDNMWMCEV
jgi:hypothetical protein